VRGSELCRFRPLFGTVVMASDRARLDKRIGSFGGGADVFYVSLDPGPLRFRVAQDGERDGRSGVGLAAGSCQGVGVRVRVGVRAGVGVGGE